MWWKINKTNEFKIENHKEKSGRGSGGVCDDLSDTDDLGPGEAPSTEDFLNTPVTCLWIDRFEEEDYGEIE